MKKLLFVSLLGIISTPTAFGATSATPWWLQPTICRINTTNCYIGMGTGYDAELWDASANCRGMKLICPEALVSGGTEPEAIGKTDLDNTKKIKSDYDVKVLANGCFGVRKTEGNGTTAMIDGKYVNIWCRGILDNPDEIVLNGEITNGPQPTCTELAANGYAAVLNGKCYGKYYNPAEYYIECGTALLPSRLIILNGADHTATTSANTPATINEARNLFDSMYSASKKQHDLHFKAVQ